MSKINTVIYPTIVKASASINASLTGFNKTYNATQRTAIKLSITANAKLQILYTTYKADLGFARTKMVKMLAEVKSVKDSFCMCKSGVATTTTTTTTEATTPEEEETEEDDD